MTICGNENDANMLKCILNKFYIIFVQNHHLSPDNLRAHSWSHECPTITCPGFVVLQRLLIRLSHLPQVYEAMSALLVGMKANHTAEGKVGHLSFCESFSSSFLTQQCWYFVPFAGVFG